MKLLVFGLFAALLIAGCMTQPETTPVLGHNNGQSEGQGTQNASQQPTNETFRYIDVHSHLQGKVSPTENDFEGAADIAVNAMDKWKIKKMIVMPPPFTGQPSQKNGVFDIDQMSGVLKKYPGRFSFLGGGGELNVLIQKAVTNKENITIEQFKEKARQIADTEGFVGFGEMATQHFCLGPGHVYEEADPDNELFKALVDVAAERNVPIDIHQEAVVEDMTFPTLVTGGCTANPANLSANIEKFKNLLTYAKNKNVSIIWDHVGWDNTGERTPALCDELLGNYSNLYMSIKISSFDSLPDNRIVDMNGTVKKEWLDLFEKYPDRFMMGADQFFSSPKSMQDRFPQSMDSTWSIIDQLPSDLKRKIGYENAVDVFRLAD